LQPIPHHNARPVAGKAHGVIGVWRGAGGREAGARRTKKPRHALPIGGFQKCEDIFGNGVAGPVEVDGFPERTDARGDQMVQGGPEFEFRGRADGGVLRLVQPVGGKAVLVEGDQVGAHRQATGYAPDFLRGVQGPGQNAGGEANPLGQWGGGGCIGAPLPPEILEFRFKEEVHAGDLEGDIVGGLGFCLLEGLPCGLELWLRFQNATTARQRAETPAQESAASAINFLK